MAACACFREKSSMRPTASENGRETHRSVRGENGWSSGISSDLRDHQDRAGRKGPPVHPGLLVLGSLESSTTRSEMAISAPLEEAPLARRSDLLPEARSQRPLRRFWRAFTCRSEERRV